jgi:hypothetical protein
MMRELFFLVRAGAPWSSGHKMKTACLKRRNGAAFSIVELAMSIAIISLGIVVLLGLLPGGLNSIRSASDRKTAAFALKTIQSRLVSAPAVWDNHQYVQEVPGVTGASWKIGDPPLPTETLFLNSAGHVEYNSALRSMQMRIDITPPKSLSSAGMARINIAWPHTAAWHGNQWVNAKGCLVSTVYFYPRRD